jgi:DNA-binding XRE family transcriptional regulator
MFFLSAAPGGRDPCCPGLLPEDQGQCTIRRSQKEDGLSRKSSLRRAFPVLQWNIGYSLRKVFSGAFLRKVFPDGKNRKTKIPFRFPAFSFSFLISFQKGSEDMHVPYNERIRNLRTENRLSQQKVAAVLGVSPRTYSDYETGRCRIPIDSLIQLARFYDVDLNYIAGISNIRKEYPFI